MPQSVADEVVGRCLERLMLLHKDAVVSFLTIEPAIPDSVGFVLDETARLRKRVEELPLSERSQVALATSAFQETLRAAVAPGVSGLGPRTARSPGSLMQEIRKKLGDKDILALWRSFFEYFANAVFEEKYGRDPKSRVRTITFRQRLAPWVATRTVEALYPSSTPDVETAIRAFREAFDAARRAVSEEETRPS